MTIEFQISALKARIFDLQRAIESGELVGVRKITLDYQRGDLRQLRARLAKLEA